MSLEQTTRIQHDLFEYFPLLGRFRSTRSLEQSELYRTLRPKILKVLNSYELDSLASTPPAESYYRAVAWNIERGTHFDGILHFLKNHPILSGIDLLLLTEADLGMARSKNRNVAQELAKDLGMNYFFAPSYLNLAKGAGIEHESEGQNEIGIHGNALLSRYPIRKPRIVSFPNPHDKMKGREKRLGSQRALIATIDFPGTPLRAACIHVDVRSTPRHRREEVKSVVESLCQEGKGPALIGGDWNTSTYDAHSAFSAILGFWWRVFNGIDNMVKNHYPYPERRFERKLFRMLEANGFDYKECNERGVPTQHYDFKSRAQFKNLREWIPLWCFKFIEWSLRNNDGRCSFKLDWFAQRGLKVLAPGQMESPRKGPSLSPKVIGSLIHKGQPISDHDPIVVDFSPIPDKSV